MAYPSGKKRFENFLLEHKSTITLRNYGKRSGSLWEGNDLLLQLGAIIQMTSFWSSHKNGTDDVERFMSKSLSSLLKALDKEELQLPDAEILKHSNRKGASEAVGFYCGLASIL